MPLDDLNLNLMAYDIAFKCPQMFHEAFMGLSSASIDVFVTTRLRFAFDLVDPRLFNLRNRYLCRM
jgi:hypothetical protein